MTGPLLYTSASRVCGDDCTHEVSSRCAESGRVSVPVVEPCDMCDGEGLTWAQTPVYSTPTTPSYYHCPQCDGSGERPCRWSRIVCGDPVRWGKASQRPAIVVSILLPGHNPWLDIRHEDDGSFEKKRAHSLTLDLSALADNQGHRMPHERWPG